LCKRQGTLIPGPGEPQGKKGRVQGTSRRRGFSKSKRGLRRLQSARGSGGDSSETQVTKESPNSEISRFQHYRDFPAWENVRTEAVSSHEKRGWAMLGWLGAQGAHLILRNWKTRGRLRGYHTVEERYDGNTYLLVRRGGPEGLPYSSWGEGKSYKFLH